MGGRRRGDGPTEIVKVWPILPIPKVGDASSLAQLISPDQLRETGTIIITEISNAYTEDTLLGRPDGKPLPPDEWVFWEIAWVDAHGKCGQPRRFVPMGTPSYVPGSAEWQVTLVKANEDRERITGMLR